MACPGPEFLGRYESLSAASSLNNRLKSGRCRRFRRRPTAPGDHQSGLVLKRSPAQAAWPSLTDGRSKWSRSLPLRARIFFFKIEPRPFHFTYTIYKIYKGTLVPKKPQTLQLQLLLVASCYLLKPRYLSIF